MTLYRKLKKMLGVARPGLYEVLPSFGFFSADRSLALAVRGPQHKIKKVMLTRVGSKRDFLNLTGVEFILDNGNKMGANQVKRVSVSSQRENDDPTKMLRAEKFHTQAEVQPWWQVEFKTPKNLKEIRVLNRQDEWGKRSDLIQVSVTPSANENEWQTLYHRELPESKRELLAPLLEQFPLFSRGYTRSKLLRDAVDYLERVQVKEKQKLPIKTLQCFLQILPMWSRKPIEQSKSDFDNEIKILAHCLSVCWESRFRVNPREFSVLLKSKASIKQLESEVNRIRDAQGGDIVMITKHGVAARSKLLLNPKKNIRAMKKIMAELEALNTKPMLAYGTLLGAVRDQAFIGHDDDVDILINVGGDSRASVEKNMNELCSRLKERGYKIGAENHNLNRHIRDTESKFVLDVFPYWIEKGQAKLHMEKMKIRGIPAEILAERDEITFYEERFPIPHKPHAFLEERYGSTWHTPDEFHEWPWDLE